MIDHLKFKKEKFRKQIEYALTSNLVGIFPQNTLSPSEIEEWSRRELPNHWNILQNAGRIQTGDWDIKEDFSVSGNYDRVYYLDCVYDDVNFHNSTFHQSMVSHFIDSVPWEETTYIKCLFDAVDSEGFAIWGGKQYSKSDILKRASEIDELYETIKQNGYKSQRSLGSSKKNQIENEILVDIGREGNPLLVDGKHRLSIAKILGVDDIIVTVMIVHNNWLETENQPSDNNLLE